MKLSVSFHPQGLTVSAKTPATKLSTGNLVVKEFIERPAYEGEYTVTPSPETQVLETNGLRMTGNITVAPIPQNYGLITWDGTTITVS